MVSRVTRDTVVPVGALAIVRTFFAVGQMGLSLNYLVLMVLLTMPRTALPMAGMGSTGEENMSVNYVSMLATCVMTTGRTVLSSEDRSTVASMVGLATVSLVVNVRGTVCYELRRARMMLVYLSSRSDGATRTRNVLSA